jgi:antitoxin CptB
VTAAHEDPIDERALSRLRWRCRRGLLENDLFIQRFFARYEHSITPQQAQALETLMDLSDNDLLDLLLGRTALPPPGDTPQAREVLHMLRSRQP